MSAIAKHHELPAGHPDKPWWTYADLAAVFGLAVSHVPRRVAALPGFPAPLPWSRKEKRWHPRAVLQFKDRAEREARAAPAPSLAVVPGKSA